MPNSHDTFVLRVILSIDANITIPGSFPIRTSPGAEYFIGFTYITGLPAATGWHLQWTIVDDAGDTYPSESSPSVEITPRVPENIGNAAEVRNGSVRGTVPRPIGNRQYNAILTILQA